MDKVNCGLSRRIGYVQMCCACKKPEKEEQTITTVMTTSAHPFKKITKEIKYICKTCGFPIMPEKNN